MKKLISVILTLAMLLPQAAIAADDEIKVLLDGERIEFDVQPIIVNDRVLVPMRAIFEALGAEVSYRLQDGEQFVDAKKHYSNSANPRGYDIQVGFTINSTHMAYTYIHGGKGDFSRIILDTPPIIVNNRTLVPLRAISEAFGSDVQWDGETRAVSIISNRTVTPEPIDNYTDKLMSELPQDENYVVSPFSLKIAMLMAANGAKGDTQSEILDAFEVYDIEEFNKYAKQLIADLNADDKAEVNIANSIWFNKDIGGKNADFSDTFKNIIKNSYSGTAETVTNKNSIEKVNEWTEKQTNGKIKNLLEEDNREYLAALVNAIYIKADWKLPFEKEATYKETFTDIDGKETEIDFMHQTNYFDYYENEDAKIVKMPYKNDMSMYVVLGDAENLGLSINNMNNKKVSLSLPKFKLDYSADLKDILKNMGIKRAFSDKNSDFKSMVQNMMIPFKLDNVFQKAIIEVDEKGTEAAAAPAVMLEATSALTETEEIIEFKADKPFTYYILDDEHNEILFAGRYVK